MVLSGIGWLVLVGRVVRICVLSLVHSSCPEVRGTGSNLVFDADRVHSSCPEVRDTGGNLDVRGVGPNRWLASRCLPWPTVASRCLICLGYFVRL